MRGRRTPPWLLLSLLAALALPALAEQHVEYDRSVDFGKYRSYAYRKGTPAARPEIQEWIERTVDRELAADGLVRVEGDADLYVKTYAYAETGMSQTLNFAYDPAWDVGVVYMDARGVTTGTLIVDLVDAGTGGTVWRGQASKAVATDPDKAKRKIDALTRKMFKSFPPR